MAAARKNGCAHLCAVLFGARVFSLFSVFYFLVYRSARKLLSLSSVVELEPKSIFVFLLLQHMYVFLNCFCLCVFFWCIPCTVVMVAHAQASTWG